MTILAMWNAAPRSRLREARQRARLTQARAAALMGVSPGWYATVEREPTFLTPRLAELAAKVYGCNVEEITGVGAQS